MSKVLAEFVPFAEAGHGFRVRLEWKAADLWISAFWAHSSYDAGYHTGRQLDVWICCLPCLPLHITFRWPPTRDK